MLSAKGSAQPVDPQDDQEEYEEYEDEAEDDFAYDEAQAERRRMEAQAGPSGADAALAAAGVPLDAPADGDEAAQEEGEGETGPSPGSEYGFVEPPARAIFLPDLFAKALELGTAEVLDETHHDVAVFGVTDDAAQLCEGELYVATSRVVGGELVWGHEGGALEAAVAAGAVGVVLAAGVEVEAGALPEGLAVVYSEDVDDLAARLAMAFYDEPSTALRVVAVTGTSGKTTVSWLVRGVLEEAGQLTGLTGSIEYALADARLDGSGEIWEPDAPDATAGRECSAPFYLAPYQGKYELDAGDTPDGLHMQKLLASMRDRGGTAAVLEASAEGLATGAFDWVDVDVAVFTNLGEEPQHVVAHGGTQEYAAAKAQLFQGMTDPERHRLVLNADDEASLDMRSAAAPDVPAITYALEDGSADVWAEVLELSVWETRMIVRTPIGRLEIISNLVGRHNAYNILAAVATGLVLGVPLPSIVAGIESVEVVPGRSEVVNGTLLGDDGQPVPTQLPADFAVIVDAADTPARLEVLLNGLREAGAARVLTVVGADGVGPGLDGGVDPDARKALGAVAHQLSDYVIVTNSSPRLEDPGELAAGLVAGLPEDVTAQYAAYVYQPFQDQGRVPLWFEPFLQSAQRTARRFVMEDRFSAIRAAIGTARPADVVVIVGRGHSEVVEHPDGEGGMLRGWFDDRVEARNALSKLQFLYSLGALDRSELPWRGPGDAVDEDKSVVVEM